MFDQSNNTGAIDRKMDGWVPTVIINLRHLNISFNSFYKFMFDFKKKMRFIQHLSFFTVYVPTMYLQIQFDNFPLS